MAYKDLEPISKQLTIVVGLTVVGFMAFGLALSFYRNILFDEHLKEIAQQNEDLQQQINQSQSDLDYYRSAQYKDKYAKENLGRLNPGEKILIITEEQNPVEETATPDKSRNEKIQAEFEESLRQMPIYLHWKLFLFERDKLEELRRGLK